MFFKNKEYSTQIAFGLFYDIFLLSVSLRIIMLILSYGGTLYIGVLTGGGIYTAEISKHYK